MPLNMPTGPTDGPQVRIWQFKNANSGLCLRVTAPGATATGVTTVDCSPVESVSFFRDKWTLMSTPDNSALLIQSLFDPTRCLAWVTGGNPDPIPGGATAGAKPCNGNDIAQQMALPRLTPTPAGTSAVR